MIILFFIIAVVVSLPVAAIVLVSLASRQEDRRFSLGGPARSRVQATSRWILDFSTEAGSDWSGAAEEPESIQSARSHRRIDSQLLATRMVNFRQAA